MITFVSIWSHWVLFTKAQEHRFQLKYNQQTISTTTHNHRCFNFQHCCDYLNHYRLHVQLFNHVYQQRTNNRITNYVCIDAYYNDYIKFKLDDFFDYFWTFATLTILLHQSLSIWHLQIKNSVWFNGLFLLNGLYVGFVDISISLRELAMNNGYDSSHKELIVSSVCNCTKCDVIGYLTLILHVKPKQSTNLYHILNACACLYHCSDAQQHWSQSISILLLLLLLNDNT